MQYTVPERTQPALARVSGGFCVRLHFSVPYFEREGILVSDSIVSMLLLQILLIFLNAVFASAEIAVISMSDAKLAALASQ